MISFLQILKTKVSYEIILYKYIINDHGALYEWM